jgi:hypothetical protein
MMRRERMPHARRGMPARMIDVPVVIAAWAMTAVPVWIGVVARGAAERITGVRLKKGT